jgi:hypothetical protein
MTSVKTAKLLILAAAGLSFLFSVYLWFLVDQEQGVFVGLWVPSILSFGALVTNGMTDWIVFLVGCFATLLCVVAAVILVYAVETDVKD